MATLSPPAAPPFALLCWTDGHDLFIELPLTQGEGSYVARYPLSEGGLAKALAHMARAHEENPAPKPYQHPAAQPTVRKFSNFTETQRDLAQAVLRKLKIIGSGTN